ncbi:MAG: hypothetical protein LBD34_00110 [Puniceicoccales bacterium]|jgi:hypothetical protein|nr:hypothetical protein [Puniceicoccales bacterium]
MISFLIAIVYYGVLFLCQLFNGFILFPGVLVIPVGLFIHGPSIYLDSIRATILYCLIGPILDVIFPFLPFGFSTVFCIFFYCMQRAMFRSGHPLLPLHRIGIEQVANISYILSLFIFRHTSFGILQFLSTAGVSQICTFLLSDKMALCHKKLMFVYDNYMKYQR